MGCVHCSKDEREYSERDEGPPSSSVEIEETWVSKNFDETVRLQSEKRQEWIQEKRGDTLQGIAERTCSAPRLANSSAALFTGKNECLGTHRSLIVKETVPSRSATEFELKGKDEGEDRVVRTERKTERRRREEKWHTSWCCQD